ncbi:MAG: amino acid permease [Oscillospiraceae bacterium]|nr:amino acid permease [Oscillospiraceae bacterium]
MIKRESTLPDKSPGLLRRLSPLAVWALAFGCSVGWGSFVMPGTTFLPIAGPLGTVIGIGIGMLIMVVIGYNYHFLMNRYPDAGGTVSFSNNAFGHDYGFLSAWFLGLVYLAIIWANSTAIPLIFRSIFGDVLRFGYCYTLAGYDIYIGEVMASLVAVFAFGLICMRGTRAAATVQTVMSLLLVGGVLFGFVAVFVKVDVTPTLQELEPLFAPENKPFFSVMLIVFLAPWAFAGFESVSHSAEEFRFSTKKTFRIMVIALLTAAAAYMMLALIGAAALPEGFTSRSEYLAGLNSQSGLRGMPVLFSIYAATGTPGLVILGIAAAAAIITGLVGNMTAASRMLYSVAKDGLIPDGLSQLNRHGAPEKAILLLIALAIPIPFLGRSAIGWIIDVNTIGVTVAYFFTSAAAFLTARRALHDDGSIKGCRGVCATGILGAVISAAFLVYYLIPNKSNVADLSTESYLMLLSWSVLGFIAYYFVFRNDGTRRMGKSTAAWIVLLLLIFFTSIVWLVGTTDDATKTAVDEMSENYSEMLDRGESAEREQAIGDFSQQLYNRIHHVTSTILRNTVIQFGLFLLSLLIIFRVYSMVQKRHQTAVEDKTVAEQSSAAKSTFLSNMSHDIRTPMNAIVGYVSLAKREKELPPRVSDYLDKIENSSAHLLALINDVLEMSRIEAGRMELMPVPTDVRKLMSEVQGMFSTQMETKGLTYVVTCEDVSDPKVLCDGNRMNRVLLNLISNAYKFTPEGGTVSVILRQTARKGNMADFELRVKDTGVGMSPEFAAKVFEAYEREKTETIEGIQGTGLGTAITKSIVELMGGTIEVKSEQGKGSEFIVRVSFPVDPAAGETVGLSADDMAAAAAFAGMRVLLVEDDKDNREVEQKLLEDAGFIVDVAENGEDAVEIIAASMPGEYAVVFMDIEMPIKNGYNATKLIRSLRNRSLAEIPIIAMTAKAFSEDISAALEAGMNGHIAKPVDMKNVIDTLTGVLKR